MDPLSFADIRSPNERNISATTYPWSTPATSCPSPNEDHLIDNEILSVLAGYETPDTSGNSLGILESSSMLAASLPLHQFEDQHMNSVGMDCFKISEGLPISLGHETLESKFNPHLGTSNQDEAADCVMAGDGNLSSHLERMTMIHNVDHTSESVKSGQSRENAPLASDLLTKSCLQ
jgi:hypothetical protein